MDDYPFPQGVSIHPSWFSRTSALFPEHPKVFIRLFLPVIA
jgi:hypothetical protein